MRADNKKPNIVYRNFGDWLFNYDHAAFIVLLVFAYVYYLATTTEA
jgi:hypothetical protein